MHLVCSQETVVAAHSRDDKGWEVRCEAEGSLGGGGGGEWAGGGGGGLWLYHSKVNDVLSCFLILCSSDPSLQIRCVMLDGIVTIGL